MSPGELGPFLSRNTPRLLAIVFGVMISMFVVTGFYTKSYKREKRERAAQQYEAGMALAKDGHYEQAAELHAEAMSLSRGTAQSLNYQQALALALVEAGRTSEAETYLQQLTTADPSNGIANLMLARIYVARNEQDLAMQHYSRAVYGLWDDNPREQRMRVRLELVGLFELAGRYTEMESELLRMLQDAPDDPEMKKRIGFLFLSAKSYDNAAKLFAEVVAEDRRDTEALAGLGDAEFERAHYLSAGTAYRRALQYDDAGEETKAKLTIVDEIAQLDPTIRGLGSYTRLERSRELVKRALEELSYCLPEDREMLPDGVPELVDAAERLVAGKTKQQRTIEAVDENIALAEALESYRSLNCESAPAPDHALQLVLKKLAN
jgi:tetratricopeptide (TPR) repeat protein